MLMLMCMYFSMIMDIMPILSSKLLYVQFLGFHMIYNVENKIFNDVLGWGGELALQSKQINLLER